MIIYFASGNQHKKNELEKLFHGFTLLLPRDAGIEFTPEETGTSFHENALLKARELYRLLAARRPSFYSPGDPVIADDSGLCVDALNGRPGIFSARYSGAAHNAANGKKLESAERNALLLAELGGNPRRSARFVCAMALLFGEDRFHMAQETAEGEIVTGAEYTRGSGGFGYDPIFFVPELERTMAELSEAEKNRISHRGKAGRAIADILRNGI
jgi:XTP/dITP diphosphohydrolase